MEVSRSVDDVIIGWVRELSSVITPLFFRGAVLYIFFCGAIVLQKFFIEGSVTFFTLFLIYSRSIHFRIFIKLRQADFKEKMNDVERALGDRSRIDLTPRQVAEIYKTHDIELTSEGSSFTNNHATLIFYMWMAAYLSLVADISPNGQCAKMALMRSNLIGIIRRHSTNCTRTKWREKAIRP